MLNSVLGYFSFAILLALLATVRYVDILWQRRRLARSNGCKLPPSLPQADNLLGLGTIRESYHHYQQGSYLSLSKDRFDQFGNTYRFVQLGSAVINTIEPENVKAILSTRFQDFSVGFKRQTAFEPLIGHGIFTADGSDWKQSRKMLQPAFAKDELNDLSALERNVQALLSEVTDQPVNLQQSFLALTIDFATYFLFGESTAAPRSPESAANARSFGTAFDRAQKNVAKFFALGPFSVLACDPQFKRDQKTVSSYVDGFIEKALSSPQNKGEKRSFLNELSKHTQDVSLLRGGLLNILLAGRDTTASLLSNLWFVLARRPDIYGRLQEEIHVLNGKVPTRDDLKSLSYLKSCLDESLRLHPPVPRNSRTAIRDTILPVGGGEDGKSPIFVGRGTEVGYQVFAMHRRKDIWGSDADEFVPERWTRKDRPRPHWAYLPFNGGPRICPGQQLALTEASYVTARLLQEFKSVKSSSEPGSSICSDGWREDLGLTCTTAEGTWVRLTRNACGI